MSNSPHWCSASANFRSDWRPSAILRGALVVLGLLAGLSLLASDLPRAFAWPAAIAGAGWGAWLARREARRPPIALAWRADGALFVDGARVEAT